MSREKPAIGHSNKILRVYNRKQREKTRIFSRQYKFFPRS